MSYIETIKNTLGLYLLKDKSIKQLSKDKQGVLYSFITIILALVFGSMGNLIQPTLGLNVFSLGFGVILVLISFLILHGLAILFGGKAKINEYFRVYGQLSISSWFIIIPVVGQIIVSILGIWSIIVNIIILRRVHKLSLLKSVIIVFLPVFIGLLIFFLILAYLTATFISTGPVIV